MTHPQPPENLSEWATSVWIELTQAHDFAAHELVVFARALRWWDRSDAALVAAETAEGPELARLTKLSLDAATSALRHWRALRFPATDAAGRG